MRIRYDEGAIISTLKCLEVFIKCPISLFTDTGAPVGLCFTSGFIQYCHKVRGRWENDKRCRTSDKAICQECKERGEAITRRCHAGVYETIVPIKHADTLLGFVMFGGYRIAGDEINIVEYAESLSMDPALLCRTYETVNILTREEVDAAIGLVKVCIEHILNRDLVCVPTYERAEQIKTYIDTHTSTPMTIELLCAELFISKRHLQKIFKDTYGITVKQYILDKQLALAEHLLITTDMTIAEVALASGFSDYNNFIQRFKQSRGMTPLRFRKAHRE